LLVLGSGVALNLQNPGIHLLIVIDNPEGEESNWIEHLGQFGY
jgi:hypothetical protein